MSAGAELDFDQTHWIAKVRKGPLPTYYYHGHFVEVLRFVEAHYAHALLDEHRAFIESFRTLTRPAQCLYVRLVNRKAQVFSVERLRYPELGDTHPIVDELRLREFISAPSAECYGDVLRFLTRSEIYDVLLPRFAGMARSLKKVELVDFAREHMSGDEFMRALQHTRIFVQGRADEVRYLLFLYFGRVQDGLSRFTMRDLGLVRARDADAAYEPRFLERAEALESYFFAVLTRAARDATPGDLEHIAGRMHEWPEANFPASAALRDDAAQRLGRLAEKAGLSAVAESFYGTGESATCSERLVRLMLADGRHDDARRFLERCMDSPRSHEELLVARDLYERKFGRKRTSVVTDVLRSGEVIEIDESRSGSPERAAIEYFVNRGHAAYRSENTVWRTLFGLLFWDELFTAGQSQSHSPFESLPASLTNGTFYGANQGRIEEKLQRLANRPSDIRQELLKTSTRQYGKANGVFRWTQSMSEPVFALLDHADGEPLATMLRSFCQSYSDARYGYPDLMVVDDDGIRFVEVKTEGDKLRRNQLMRIEQLRAAGFRADVVRIRWILDPRQAYVVVDVETTGGRGDRHRVTEIGAVKVVDGDIVARFGTLLNPQRVIPADIIRLTGITPAMVQDAPYFADIADDFDAFMVDAIFVAHNVEFDYGFIAGEYRRIGRRFEYPRLCTCTSMRRLYPGRRSYSLASLCRDFEIPLESHHRAMCDAEAAAQLLLLVNERRQAG